MTQGSTVAGPVSRRRYVRRVGAPQTQVVDDDDDEDGDAAGAEGAAACEVPVEPFDESAGFAVVDSDEELEPLSDDEPSEPDDPVDDDEPDDVPLRASFL